MAYRLERDETVASGVMRIAREQIDRGIAEMESRELSVGDKAHQVRKRCKKIRGLIRLVRGSMKDRYKRENRCYRDIARDLAPVRDADSDIETYDDLMGRFSSQIDKAGLAPVRQRLSWKRKRLLENEIDADSLASDIIARLKEGRARLDGWRLSHMGFDALAAGLRKSYKRGRKGFKRLLRAGSPESATAHEWRKRVKYHWYHLRLLEAVWPEITRRFANETHKISDFLGDSHDLAVLSTTLTTDLTDADTRQQETLLGLAEQERLVMLQGALRLGSKVFALKPKRVAKALGAYWAAWRNEPRPRWMPQARGDNRNRKLNA
jgi:CHAD domain-containing protein